jgi:predicted nucleotidyltransferase
MTSKKNPETVASDFASELRKAFGDDLLSVLLVGSAARGDYVPGKSDVNTLVLLTSDGMDWLEKAYPVVRPRLKKGLAVPHFMTPESVSNALDSYPLEFLDFKTFHKVILGPDPLADITIPHEPLRLQIERELRGKLFLLRQIYASHAGKENQLREALRRSVSVFSAVFQGILELVGEPIPSARADLFRQAAMAVGFSDQVFQQVLAVRTGAKKKNLRVIFKDLMKEITGIVVWVDHYKIKPSS